MGIAVSGWRLARAVAIAGQELHHRVLGVVSGTGLQIAMVGRLQRGEQETIDALREFNPRIAEEIMNDYPVRGIGEKHKFPAKPEALVIGNSRLKGKITRLAMAAAYVEVTLAKKGHSGEIGMNLLEKVQLPHLPTVLGAMMAGVDYLLVGAGIPHQFPQVLENFAHGLPASYSIDVAGADQKHIMTLDPREYVPDGVELQRPKFFPVVSSHVLAMRLARMKGVDGFIVEGPTAGGHNAPARGKELDEIGQPIYTDKDAPDLRKIAELGLPFWLAGGTVDKLSDAQKRGAAGVQVGSAFALCEESGMRKDIASRIRAGIADDSLRVITSAVASPSGYPFQVVQLPDTLSQKEVYERRERNCRLGGLVQAFVKAYGSDGAVERIGFRCPAEPVNVYIRKGGRESDAEGAVCLCNGLASTVGLANDNEPPIATLGKEFADLKPLIENAPNGSYTAADVVHHVFAGKCTVSPQG